MSLRMSLMSASTKSREIFLPRLAMDGALGTAGARDAKGVISAAWSTSIRSTVPSALTLKGTARFNCAVTMT
jgi:hypothetical protein